MNITNMTEIEERFKPKPDSMFLGRSAFGVVDSPPERPIFRFKAIY